VKVNGWVSLQKMEKCGKTCKIVKIYKIEKISMSNIGRYNRIKRNVRRSFVTVYKVTKSKKEAIAFMSVQYIRLTWVKLVSERVTCTVNKHKGKCTAVYSTNRQSECDTSSERYLPPVYVKKVKGSITKVKVGINLVVMVVRYVSYGKIFDVYNSFKVSGCHNRMVIVIRYANEKVCGTPRLMTEWCVNYGITKKGNVSLNVFGCCYRMVIDRMYARYCCKVKKILVNKENDNCVCNKSGSIDEGIDEKVRGIIRIEQTFGKSTDEVTILNEYRIRITGSIKDEVDWKAVLVIVGTNFRYLDEHCLSVSAKMEQGDIGAEQVMESNPPHQEASAGEYLLSVVPLVVMATYGIYVTCDLSKSEVINTLLMIVLQSYLSCRLNLSKMAINTMLGINDLRWYLICIYVTCDLSKSEGINTLLMIVLHCYISCRPNLSKMPINIMLGNNYLRWYPICKSLNVLIKNCPLNNFDRCTDYHSIKRQHNGTPYGSIRNIRNMYMKPTAAQDTCTSTYNLYLKSKSSSSAGPLYREHVAYNCYKYTSPICVDGLYCPSKRLSKKIIILRKMPISKIWKHTPYVVKLESNWHNCYRE
jgi:hypothetical protein